MKLVVPLIQASISFACIGCVLHYFYFFFRKPVEFYRFNYEERHVTRLQRFFRYPYILIVFGSIWYTLYVIGDRALSWVPTDLFDFGEATTGGMIALLGSFWAAFALISGMSSFSEKLVKDRASPDEWVW